MPKVKPKRPRSKQVEINIHATCVAIGGHGVLLLGKSGAGKSGVALQLMDGGARLVADDRTILSASGGALHARAPATIAGLLEVRGLGIVKLPARPRAKVALVVRLGREGPRLPEPGHYRALGTMTPEITLDARFASTPARIRIALRAVTKGLLRDTFNPK